jgi:hypothetical protein
MHAIITTSGTIHNGSSIFDFPEGLGKIEACLQAFGKFHFQSDTASKNGSV